MDWYYKSHSILLMMKKLLSMLILLILVSINSVDPVTIENVVLNRKMFRFEMCVCVFRMNLHWFSVNWLSSRLKIIICRIKLANGILWSIWKPLEDQSKLISDRVKSVPILTKEKILFQRNSFTNNFTVEELDKIVLYLFYPFVVDQYENIL
jgi:hypothetical protein